MCLGSLFCEKMKPLPIRRLPEEIAWWIRIEAYFSAFIVPSILTKSLTPLAVIHPQSLGEPSSWLTVGFKHISFICSPTILLAYCLLFELKISNFDSSFHNTFFHCSTVQFLMFFGNFKSFLTVSLSYISFPS